MPCKRFIRRIISQNIEEEPKKEESSCTEDFPKLFANNDLSFDVLSDDDQNKQFLISDHTELHNYIEEKKSLLHQILKYIDNSDDVEENFQNLEIKLKDNKISDNKFEIKSLLLMLVKISNNHYHTENFYFKIERIIQLFKDEIIKKFSNSNLFMIFQSNKRLLYYLIQSKLITIDEFITNIITTKLKYKQYNYPEFFSKEIKKFFDVEQKISEDFEEKRKIGENDDFICTLIRKDDIDNFITYVNKNDISLKSKIKPSIYETNLFLLKNQQNMTLIEYAVFFGSIQIFKYLYLNKVPLPKTIWLYTIHGDNAEIIHILEEKNIKPTKDCLLESIKCHHNNITNYLIDNYQLLKIDNKKDFINICLKSYNYEFMELIDFGSTIYELCKYDYYTIIKILLQNNNLNLNKHKIIFKEIENKKIEMKTTPLYLAVEKENLDIINLLLCNNKIDINASIHIKTKCTKSENFENNIVNESYKEINAFSLAVENNNIEIIKLFLKNKKIDVNNKIVIGKIEYDSERIYGSDHRYEEEMTSLYLAISKSNYEIVKLLLENDKIDVNALYKSEDIKENLKNEITQTGLIKAIINKDLEMIKILLSDNKINVNIPYKSDISETNIPDTRKNNKCKYEYKKIISFLLLLLLMKFEIYNF